MTSPNSLRASDARSRREPSFVVDAAAITVILTIAATWYLSQLGFYSDDWAYMAELSWPPGASFADRLHRVLQHDGVGRPTQFLLLALFCQLFGPAPLAYHTANAIFIIGGALLFYCALREIGVGRQQAVAAPLIFAMLPHYSATRFWVTTVFCTTLSMALYFASLFALVRAMTGRQSRPGWWLAAGMAAAGSALSYEVFIPLLLLNPAAVWYGTRWFGNRQDVPVGRVVRATLLLALFIAPVVVYKLAVTPRGLGVRLGVLHQVLWFGMSLAGASLFSLGDFGIRLPVVMGRLWVQQPSAEALVTAVVCAVLVYLLLERSAAAHTDRDRWRRSALVFMAAGLLAFCAGYVIFLPVGGVSLTASSGVNTRLATAASVGMALLWTGIAAWLVTWVPSARSPERAFAIAASVLFGVVVFINGSLAACWVQAAKQQRVLVSDIRRNLAVFPEGMTLLVDGVCPYVGPAPVFESQYDLSGALQIAYDRPDIRAELITSRMTIRDEGFVSEFYGEMSTYSYGNILIYDTATGTMHPIRDAAGARTYFQSFNRRRSNDCPAGLPGRGVRLF